MSIIYEAIEKKLIEKYQMIKYRTLKISLAIK